MKILTPLRLGAAGVVLLVVAVVALWVTPSDSHYIFLPDEAHPVEPLVEVEGGKRPTDGGGIYFVDVFVRKATLLERLFPGIRDGSSLVPASEVRTRGVSDAERRRADLRAMSRSQRLAATVALRAFGYNVRARATGALIEAVVPGSPAAGRLHPGDVVVAVDRSTIRTPANLRRALVRRPAGSLVTIRVRRGPKLLRIALRTRADPESGGRPVIGVLVGQDFQVRLPISVRIDSGRIGGPSAGLPFALDILEELGRDVDRGHKVAATGQIEIDGSIVPIGGIRQKTIGVRRAGVDIFLVPAGDNAREARKYAQGLRIIPVRNFQQALRALATVPRAG